jgi:hypothetical protein
MHQLNKYLEIMWLIGAIATAIFAGYKITANGWEQNYHLLILPVICGAWYGVRRFMRLRMERLMAEQEGNEPKG